MPPSRTLKVPLKAGGCFPHPSAELMPLLPSGTSLLARARCTEGAESTFVLAAESRSAADGVDCVGLGVSPVAEQDAVVRRHTAASAVAASRTRERMGVRLTSRGGRSRPHGPRACNCPIGGMATVDSVEGRRAAPLTKESTWP